MARYQQRRRPSEKPGKGDGEGVLAHFSRAWRAKTEKGQNTLLSTTLPVVEHARPLEGLLMLCGDVVPEKWDSSANNGLESAVLLLDRCARNFN
jgi:hypothetical protein